MHIEVLPSPPSWKEVVVSVDGGTTKDPLILYYRDGGECFECLFGDPCYENDMDFGPRRVFTVGEVRERLYSEIMTGDMAWNLQVKALLKQVRKKLTISHSVRNISNLGEL